MQCQWQARSAGQVNGCLFTAHRDDDLVTSPAHDDCEPGQDLSVPMPIFSAMVVAALLCSAATILGPVLIIPTCPAAGMVVRADCWHFVPDKQIFDVLPQHAGQDTSNF